MDDKITSVIEMLAITATNINFRNSAYSVKKVRKSGTLILHQNGIARHVVASVMFCEVSFDFLFVNKLTRKRCSAHFSKCAVAESDDLLLNFARKADSHAVFLLTSDLTKTDDLEHLFVVFFFSKQYVLMRRFK